jgi:TrmH family RNA methyltransferase
VEPIRSRANARLKAARKLQAKRHRLAAGQFLAEGEDIVEEALSSGILPLETFIADGREPPPELTARLARGGPVHLVAPELMAELGSLGHPARVICVFAVDRLPARAAGADLGVHLHRVIDPGNVGTVVRAAGALGPAFLSLSPGCSDPLSAKGVRASMGAVFRVPIERNDMPPENGLTRVALVPGAPSALWEVDLRAAAVLVVGAERQGLPPEVVERCEVVAAIPHPPGADSLNAAGAATVALYEALRQRHGGSTPAQHD